MLNKLTSQTCKEWKQTDKTKNPLTGKQLNDSLIKILSKRCEELLQETSSSSYSPDTLIKAVEKHIFKNKISPSRLSPKSSSRSSTSSKSVSAPNSAEISNMRENLPYLFELSFQDFEKMKSDKHRIDNILLNYDITDPVEVKLVKKFIKFVINIPNAKSKKNKELSKSIQSRKYKKTSFQDLPDDIITLIGEKYYDIMKYDNRLHEWIDENKLELDILESMHHPGVIEMLKKKKNINWNNLSSNPFAIKLLEQNQDKIDWVFLSGNPAAIELLKENPDKIDWYYLSGNPASIELLKKNQDNIIWKNLSGNPAPGAIELLEQNQHRIFSKIDWYLLSRNPNPEAIKFLKTYKHKIVWFYLSGNTAPESIELLEQNPNKIDWKMLSANPNPEAIKLLEQNPDKIDWNSLSLNPSAIKLLKENPDNINWDNISSNRSAIKLLEHNQDKINWRQLSSNPAIFSSYRYKFSVLEKL